ncbi:protein SET DOMAIN GROUP 41 [Citrus sinensis]|nr:protein SET DOMAIN GROUP 41 [Citrus sinensis]
MRASEEIRQGEDITPPLFPLTFAFHDSLLDGHCSSCFSPLPSCCSSLPLSSAELRAALHLLHSPLPTTSLPPPPRLFGLLTNRDKLMSSSDSDVASKIREGAREMARARGNLSDDVAWEEAALCLVMTNAVEVQDDKTGRILGIAVYDKDFSWINHSCSPNACYRFSLSEPNAPSFRDEKKKRIAPHVVFDSTEAETQGKSDVCISCELKEGSKRHGPRIIVRSIKPINKGEEVTVAYTDLLQPKGMRQSELWSKYQFVCHCRRCSASPPSYVDMALEETFSSNPEFSSLSSDYNFLKDEANQKLTDWMDEVTSEYLLVGDPESCCQKLENILTQGLQGELLESEKVKIQLNLRLHPLHHLSLNAYTTLASAYKIRSIDLLALNSDIDGQQLDAFDMSRTSAAYSFLLAGATDHLFRSESSLIAASANFWASAGESLLTLARSPGWKLFVKPESPMSTSSPENHECSNCSQVDRFQVNPFLSQSQNADFQIICNEFLACITNMTRKVWGFLISGCGYLQMLKDPIDFSWLRQSSNLCHTPCCSDEESNKETEYQENICRRVMQRCDASPYVYGGAGSMWPQWNPNLLH